MSETQPLSAGEAELAYLRTCIAELLAADNELLYAIAAVLTAYVENYETEDGVYRYTATEPGQQTYHVGCGKLVQQCSCLAPYLLLARHATEGMRV